jgi:serine/threonine protein kinase
MPTGYKILEKIGAGGFGDVFLATENISGRKVAIKSLKNIGEDALEKTIHEIKIISQFYHANIVTYHTAFEDDGLLYFVMEYCENGSLADKIKIKPLELKEALRYTLSVSKALKFVHSKNIVHHDIKPSNILITNNGDAKLADFGVANTKGFTKLYTPPVISTFDNYEFNKSLDIYALGITLIELLNGIHPLLNLSSEEAIEKLKTGELGITRYPDWLQEIILKATNLKEENRFQNIDEFIEAVENNEVALNIDQNLILAAKNARSIASKLHHKKYYTLKGVIERLDRSLFNYPILMEQIGCYYLAINDIFKAKRAFEIVRQKTPSLNINKQLAIINLELGKYLLAMSLFKEHLSVNPDDIESYNLLLECYFKNKSFKNGYKLCLQLNNTFPEEICFKANLFLFDNLQVTDFNLIGSNPSKYNNKFIEYNSSIFNSKNDIINPQNVDTLISKLLFCQYSITKAKSYNNKLEIDFNGTKLEFKKEEFITIGRKGYNNIFELSGNGVSRKHCILLSYENENWLYNLNSTGLYVDDEEVKGKLRLTHKHEIKINNHIFTINIDKYKLF